MRGLFAFDCRRCLWYILLHRIFARVLWIALFYSPKLHIIILLAVVIDTRGTMKLIKTKEIVMFRPWRRIEAGSNCAVNEITQAFSTTRLGVEASKLHVRFCIDHFKYFRRSILWRAVIRMLRGLAWGVILSDRNILTFWLSSYSFDGGPMG